jgi:predicted dehydrogenase
MSIPTTRRRFMQQAAAATGAVVSMAHVAGRAAAASKSPNEKLDIGIIGCGGRGAANLSAVSGENIVALCDVDERQLGKAKASFGAAATFIDFRKMIDGQKMDAVTVSTTSMTHALAAVRAMRKGLSVYCEKPLAHTVAEARLMRETYLAHKDKIATQMGTQIHATDNYRRVVELVQTGAIGNVTEAHVWCNRFSSQSPPPTGEAPVPKGLHWDLWLGPAPYRPFQNGYMPGNLTWNRYWDFGNGILGDMGSHLIDLPYWALALQFPVTCEADAPPADPVIYPRRLKITWEHPSRGQGAHEQPCKVVWYDGEAKPNELLGLDLKGYGIGVIFVGEKGKLLADYGRRTVYPNGGDPQPNAKPAKQIYPPSKGHHAEWIYACKNDPTTTLCNFDYSGRLIEHNLLGTVAHRVGKKLEWDAKTLTATNAPEAQKYIHKEYRKGWAIEHFA